MQFKGIGRSSNFAKAGKSAADETVRAFAAARRNSTDFGKLTQKATNIRSAEKKAAIKAGAQVTQAGIEAQGYVKKNEIIQKGEAARDKGKRKAGALAAGGKLIASAGAYVGEKRTKREVGSEDSYFDTRIAANKKSADDLRAQAKNYGTGSDTSTPKTGTDGELVATATPPPKTGGGLMGARKELADAIAGPESGSWGYEAFNQGGAAGGTKVLGKSGSYKDTYGTSLTDMTLGEIFHRQNTKQRGLSLDDHFKTGGLHAVGRYQFIGSTLQDEVSKMGLSHDTKFTPEVQDSIFFSHIKRVGDISPWVGPSVNYGKDKKDHLNSLIPQI